MFGEVKLHHGGTIYAGCNQLQDESSEILASLVGGGSLGKINSFYLEFANAATPDEEVSGSLIGPSQGIEYFLGLTAPWDFIVQKLELPPVIQGNSVTFSAVVAPGTGFFGRPFGGESANTRLCAMALGVSHPTDISQDKLFSYKLWTPAKIITTEQVYVEWTINF